VADGVDTGVYRQQSVRRDPSPNTASAESKLHQLPTGYSAMLALSQGVQRKLT
jgi:hypothetical protein